MGGQHLFVAASGCVCERLNRLWALESGSGSGSSLLIIVGGGRSCRIMFRSAWGKADNFLICAKVGRQPMKRKLNNLLLEK